MEFRGQQTGVALCSFGPAAVYGQSGYCSCFDMSATASVITTFSDGCLGLDNDEGRSEV